MSCHFLSPLGLSLHKFILKGTYVFVDNLQSHKIGFISYFHTRNKSNLYKAGQRTERGILYSVNKCHFILKSLPSHSSIQYLRSISVLPSSPTILFPSFRMVQAQYGKEKKFILSYSICNFNTSTP